MDAKKWLGTGLVLLSLISCGGGGGSGSNEATPAPSAIVTGQIVTDATSLSITVQEIDSENIIAETILDNKVSFSLALDDVKKDRYLIITATDLANNLTLRTVIDSDDLLSNKNGYSSILTTISNYSEAALVLAEFHKPENITSYILNLLAEDEEGTPQDTNNNFVNELAAKINSMIQQNTTGDEIAYRSEIYTNALKMIWPALIESESENKISLPSNYIWEKINIDLVDYSGVNLAALQDKNITINTGIPSTAELTFELLVDGQDPHRFTLSSMVVKTTELLSETIMPGSSTTISTGQLSLIPDSESFTSATNVKVSEIVQLPEGWPANIVKSFNVEIDGEPKAPVTVNWKLTENQNAANIRLVHIDPELKETKFIHPIKYNVADHSVDFSVPSFSPLGVVDKLVDLISPDKCPNYTFASTITIEDVKEDTDCVFEYIKFEIIDYLEEKSRIDILNNQVKSSFDRPDRKEIITQYFLRLASKSLVSFLQLAEGPEREANLQALKKLNVDYGVFEWEKDAYAEYKVIQAKISSISSILNNQRHPYIQWGNEVYTVLNNQTDPMIYNPQGNSSRYYIPVSANRLAQIGRIDIGQKFRQQIAEITNSNRHGDEIRLKCSESVQALNDAMKYTFLESPKVRIYNDDVFDDFQKNQNLEWARFLIDMTTDVANAGNTAAMETEIVKASKNAISVSEKQINTTLDISDAKSLIEENKECTEECLGATGGRWNNYNFQGVDFIIPDEVEIKLDDLGDWKDKFEECNFQVYHHTPINDNETSTPSRGYVSSENTEDPVAAIQLKIQLKVTSEAKISKSVNFSAEGTTASPTSTPVSYSWQLFKPNGSSVILTSTDSVATSLIPDVYGSYTVKLRATAGSVSATKSYSFSINEEITKDIVNGNPQYILGSEHQGTYGSKNYSRTWHLDVDADVSEIIVWAFRDSSADDGLGIALRRGQEPEVKCTTLASGTEHCSWAKNKYDYVADKQGGRNEIIEVENPEAGTYYIKAYGFEAFKNNSVYFEIKRDLDKDNDGVLNSHDWAPNDPSEGYDSDGDGVGDNADAFPNDPAASVDEDGDDQPDAWHLGQSESASTTGLKLDIAPGITSYVQNAGLISIDGKIYILPLGGEGADFSLISNPQHGQVELSDDHWLYTPDESYQGDDGFVYQAVEADGAIKHIYVSLTVSNDSGGQKIGDQSFNDVNLKTCVDETAQSFGWTLVSEMTELSCESRGIAALFGIEQLTSLTVLRLGGNQLSDISALADLTSLTTLSLWRNQLNDISALSGLTSLTELFLFGNQLSDISALSVLTSLTTLGLSANQLSDISALTGLTSLTGLRLTDNQLSDISALSGLTSLTVLRLTDNQLGDISALFSLTSLTDLEIGNNQLRDISALAGLTSLTKLGLSGNQLSDISALSGLTSLTNLVLLDNQLSDISALSGLTSLTGLSLWDNQLSDISALSGLTSLTKLSLSGNQLSDISALSGLTSLTLLVLDDNQLSDISALYNLDTLSTLKLSSNPDLPCSVIDALQARLPNASITGTGCNSEAEPQTINIVGTWNYSMTYAICPNKSEQGTATWAYFSGGYSMSTSSSNRIDPNSCSYIGAYSTASGNNYPANNPINAAEFEAGLNDYNGNWFWENTQFESQNRISLTGTVINSFPATITFTR